MNSPRNLAYPIPSMANLGPAINVLNDVIDAGDKVRQIYGAAQYIRDRFTKKKQPTMAALVPKPVSVLREGKVRRKKTPASNPSNSNQMTTVYSKAPLSAASAVLSSQGNAIHREKLHFRLGSVGTTTNIYEGATLFTMSLTPSEMGYRANAFGGLYSFFRVVSARFLYRPSVAASSNGSIMLVYDADVVDRPRVGDVVSLASESQSRFSASFPVWNNFDFPVKPTGAWKYTSRADTEPHTTTDGYLSVHSAGALTQNTVYGSLWIEAVVDFCYAAPADSASTVSTVLGSAVAPTSGVALYTWDNDRPLFVQQSSFFSRRIDAGLQNSFFIPPYHRAFYTVYVRGTAINDITDVSVGVSKGHELTVLAADGKTAYRTAEFWTNGGPGEIRPYANFTTYENGRLWISLLPYSNTAVELDKKTETKDRERPPKIEVERAPTYAQLSEPRTPANLSGNYVMLGRSVNFPSS